MTHYLYKAFEYHKPTFNVSLVKREGPMIKIITDTISGLSLEKAKELGIHVIPQIVFFGEDSYRDDTELDT